VGISGGLKRDEFAKSRLKRHPGEPRITSGAGAGVHPAEGGLK
jgi:hypothetical protein